MLKRLSKIILVIAMLLSLVFGQGSTVVAASQDDIVTIKTRLKNYFLELDTIDDGAKVETCYVSKAEDYLKRIEADGSFGDVDYQAHNNAANGAAWSPYLALDRSGESEESLCRPDRRAYCKSERGIPGDRQSE